MTPRALLLAASLALAIAAGMARGDDSPPPPTTPEGILSFADALLSQGESFRAVTEYQRLLHHFPDAPETSRALVGLGNAYAQANRWDDAAGAFERLAKTSPSAESRHLLGTALYRAGRYPEAARVLLAPGPALDADAVLGALALVREGRGEDLPPGARTTLAAEFEALPRKSPAVAGGLAAVLPGAGHLYVERPRDALVAFLLNASFLWSTWEAARREEWALSGILGFFEVGWYTGNVVSALNGAHQWNRREERRFFDRHETGLFPAWSVVPSASGASVALAWSWY